MSATEAFHPDLRRLAPWLPRAGINSMTVPMIRALMKMSSKLPRRGVNVVKVGSISVRVHRPPNSGILPALLWIHGGGYVIGTASQEDKVCREFANALGAIVVAVDYRLAPQSRFPVPLEDCYEALTWLAGQPDVDRTRIAVGGASAGGGLAAALALLARERGKVDLALQVLAYPMLDDRTATRTDIDEHNFRLWNNKQNGFGWQSYTGYAPGSSEVNGFAAPARTEDLSHLPPAWIGVGTLDLFHEEDVSYAERLRSHGVACDLHEVTGAFHGFDSVQPKAHVTREFRAAQVAALATAFG